MIIWTYPIDYKIAALPILSAFTNRTKAKKYKIDANTPHKLNYIKVKIPRIYSVAS